MVLGASGYMGSNVAPTLAAHGWHVRAVARSAAVLEAREWPGVECWAADVLQPETLGPVLEGADVVFYLVHMMWSGGDFVPVERRAAGNARSGTGCGPGTRAGSCRSDAQRQDGPFGPGLRRGEGEEEKKRRDFRCGRVPWNLCSVAGLTGAPSFGKRCGRHRGEGASQG